MPGCTSCPCHDLKPEWFKPQENLRMHKAARMGSERNGRRRRHGNGMVAPQMSNVNASEPFCVPNRRVYEGGAPEVRLRERPICPDSSMPSDIRIICHYGTDGRCSGTGSLVTAMSTQK